jgi:hypothetical protein
MGISVESEHTECPMKASIIAKDHLDEIPDYYTRLKEMEEEAETNDDDEFDGYWDDKIAEVAMMSK